MLDLNGTAEMIGRVKTMIVQDARSGQVPWTVPDYSALHSHVDANEYLIQAGQVYEPDDPASIAEINLIEDAVSAWLELGRLADYRKEHDPDDVADLVAHDAAAGLPGFTLVGPERGTGAWAWQVLGSLGEDERAAASTVCEMVALAMAYRTEARGAETDWVPLAATVIATLVDSMHGPGVAHEADTLLRWWRDLTDEERALTGVDLDGTCQAPGEAS
jgi:hypothetical protein